MHAPIRTIISGGGVACLTQGGLTRRKGSHTCLTQGGLTRRKGSHTCRNGKRLQAQGGAQELNTGLTYIHYNNQTFDCPTLLFFL
jgi:hypothetical protein